MKVHRLAQDDRPLNLDRLRDEAALLQALIAEAAHRQRQCHGDGSQADNRIMQSARKRAQA